MQIKGFITEFGNILTKYNLRAENFEPKTQYLQIIESALSFVQLDELLARCRRISGLKSTDAEIMTDICQAVSDFFRQRWYRIQHTKAPYSFKNPSEINSASISLAKLITRYVNHFIPGTVKHYSQFLYPDLNEEELRSINPKTGDLEAALQCARAAEGEEGDKRLQENLEKDIVQMLPRFKKDLVESIMQLPSESQSIFVQLIPYDNLRAYLMPNHASFDQALSADDSFSDDPLYNRILLALYVQGYIKGRSRDEDFTSLLGRILSLGNLTYSKDDKVASARQLNMFLLSARPIEEFSDYLEGLEDRFKKPSQEKNSTMSRITNRIVEISTLHLAPQQESVSQVRLAK